MSSSLSLSTEEESNKNHQKREFLKQYPFRIGLDLNRIDASVFRHHLVRQSSHLDVYLIKKFEKAVSQKQTVEFERFSHVLTTMWKESKFCDLVLETHDGRELLAHRVVLTWYSPKAK